MDEFLKNNLKTMAQLQYIDAQSEAIQKQLAGVEVRIGALSAQVTDFEQQVEQARLQLDMLKKQYRSDENEVKTIENSIIKSDDKLRAVKTNKEYQSMLKEIDDLKSKKASIEDRMLEGLEQIETAERNMDSLKADLEDLQRENQGKREAILQAAHDQRLELEELKEEREETWAGLDPKMQKVYARAKQQGGGIAVAAVVDSVCQACRMNLPPQAYIELQRLNTMSMCPHCQRIIYPKVIVEDVG
ncbi:MAG: hypothetical protein C4519_23170 [Desulfobacteraceae bacterium]|nr:MAG: hypothetical protein C4519_23170 [Desulfobacteraceae bacterium]